MKYLKMLGLAAIAAMAMAAFTAGSASATTLEVGGVTQNQSVTIEATLASGTSAILARTDGTSANTCTESTVKGSTESPYSGAKVQGPISTLTFHSCTRPVTPHLNGSLQVEHIAGSTNGTVTSSGAEVTVGSPFGTLNCKTGTGAHLGTLTGKESGQAEMDIDAVLNCGFLVSSATWKGTYVVTSPSGLGVSA